MTVNSVPDSSARAWLPLPLRAAARRAPVVGRVFDVVQWAISWGPLLQVPIRRGPVRARRFAAGVLNIVLAFAAIFAAENLVSLIMGVSAVAGVVEIVVFVAAGWAAMQLVRVVPSAPQEARGQS